MTTLLQRIALLKHKEDIGTSANLLAQNQQGFDGKDLTSRLQKILTIIKNEPIKSVDMVYLVMYDIEDNRVRTQISKYLEKKGCMRIQKSVFMARSHHNTYEELFAALKEIQSYYENNDSILFVPVNSADARSMRIIGKDVNVDTIINKPNTLFF